MNTADKSLFHPTDRMLRQFACTWIVFFTAVAARQEFRFHGHKLAVVLVVLGATLGSAGIAWPRFLKPVFVTAMTLVYPVGWTMSRILLCGIFYVLFTPAAWLLRLLGRDALGLKPQPDLPTYWRAKPAAIDKSQYLRQF